MLQISPNNILYSWVDSADWVDGVEYRLCMTPPRAPLQRCAYSHTLICIPLQPHADVQLPVCWFSCDAPCWPISLGQLLLKASSILSWRLPVHALAL